MNGREQILIETRLLTLTAGATEQVELSSECQTNENGVRAWRLADKQLTSLKQQLKALPGVSVTHSLSLTTFDGGQAQISDGAPRPKTNSPFIGLTIDVLPRVTGHSFSLLLGATSTDSDVLSDGTIVGATTNLTATCKALIPNGGGLVVASGTGGDLHRTNYWTIISAVAVDARGIRKGL